MPTIAPALFCDRTIQVLRFVMNFIDERQCAPSLADIAERFQFRAQGAAYHLNALISAGILARRRNPETGWPLVRTLYVVDMQSALRLVNGTDEGLRPVKANSQ